MGNPLKNEIWFHQVIFGGNEQGFRAGLAALAATQMKHRCTLGGANKHFLLASFVHRLSAV